MKGIRGKLRPGSKISLARLHKQEQFQVEWRGGENTAGAGQIGVSAINPATSFWKDVLETHSQAELSGAGENYSEKVLAKPKARAHGA